MTTINGLTLLVIALPLGLIWCVPALSGPEDRRQRTRPHHIGEGLSLSVMAQGFLAAGLFLAVVVTFLLFAPR